MFIEQDTYALAVPQNSFNETQPVELRDIKATPKNGFIILSILFNSSPKDEMIWSFKEGQKEYFAVKLMTVKSRLPKKIIRVNHSLLSTIFIKEDSAETMIVLNFPGGNKPPHLIKKTDHAISIYLFKSENTKTAFLNQQSKGNKLKKIKFHSGKGVLKITMQTSEPVEKMSNFDFKLKGARHLVVELPQVKSVLSKESIRLNHSLLRQIRIRRAIDKIWVILRLPKVKNLPYLIERDRTKIFVYIFKSERHKLSFVSKRAGNDTYWAKLLQYQKKNYPEPTNGKAATQPTIFVDKPSSIDFSLGGFFRTRPIQYLQPDSLLLDDNQDLRNEFRLEGKLRLTDWLSSFVSLDLDYMIFRNQSVTNEFKADLFEGYLDFRLSKLDLRLGKQIIRWGKTDGVSPVDNVNPQNMNEFFLSTLEDRKTPLLMGLAKFYGGNFALEAVYIPFFVKNNFELVGSRWAIFGQLDPSIPPETLPTIQSLEPENNSENYEWGIRLTGTKRGIDFGLSYLYCRNDLPTYNVQIPPQFPPVEVASAEKIFETIYGINQALDGQLSVFEEYRRTEIYGFEFETTFMQFGLRGEAAYFTRQPFLQSDLSLIDKPRLNFTVGFDYLSASNFYVNFQFSQDKIIDCTPDILQNPTANSLAGQIHHGFFRDKLTASFNFYYNLTTKGYLLNPELDLDIIDNLQFSIGMSLIWGMNDPNLVFYEKNDLLLISLKYVF